MNLGARSHTLPLIFSKIYIEGDVVLPVRGIFELILLLLKMNCTISLPHLDFLSYVCYTLH